MSVSALRSPPSLSQIQRPASEPVSSRPASVTQRPESTVAQEWRRDSFELECPCKKKAERLGLSA